MLGFTPRRAPSKRGITMQSSVRLGLVLTIAALVGCASTPRSATETRKYAEEGVSVNSIQRVGSEVISFGRLAGAPEREIKNTEVIYRASSVENAEIEFLTSEKLSKDEISRAQSFVRQGATEAIDVILGVYASFDSLSQSDLNLKVVLAPRGSGSFYSSRGTIGDRAPVSVIYFLPEQVQGVSSAAQHSWWSGLAANVSHELYHLHHDLDDIKSLQLDEEAAAAVTETCALIRYAHAVGASPEIDFSWIWAEPQTRQAFPDLEQGVLNVDLAQLDEVGGISVQGQAVATAVLYLLSSSGSLKVGETEEDKEFLAYCDQLTNAVPAFHLGEWQPQTSPPFRRNKDAQHSPN